VGGVRLSGKIATSGSKNAALPILLSTLLADGTHRFDNVPALRDIDSTELLLTALNCDVEREGNTMQVVVRPPVTPEASYDLVRKMRASILCLGPLLARYGEARVSLPGGCAIGSRPIDLHVDTMRRLGARIDIEEGYVVARADRLKGDRILFEKLTVGGTENALMAASLAKGTDPNLRRDRPAPGDQASLGPRGAARSRSTAAARGVSPRRGARQWRP
jgi:UDP-N-acetylglucosamine 1-carboxyvinyltransferase